MAILKGIEASVIIDGKALTEYDDEDTLDESSAHTSELSTYIEAVSDAEFSIAVTVLRSYSFVGTGIAFHLSLDGVQVRSFVCSKAKFVESGKDSRTTIAGSEVKNGEEWYLRPFKFDDIKIVEASTSMAGSEKNNNIANIGTIALDVFDANVAQRSYDAGISAVRLGQSSEIAEKELKGRNVTLKANFGESRSSTEPKFYKSKRLNTKPILSFKFKYRSKKALQSLHLIHNTPSPSPVPTTVPLEERPFDSLTPEEVQELARRFHAKCKAEREANIKPEKIKPELGVKRERDEEYKNIIESSAVKRAKARPFGQGETIELD